MSFISVKDKCVLLVGATGILGRTYSRILSQEGANLVLADLTQTNVEHLAEECGVSAITIDIGSEKSVVDAVEKAENIFGRFDGVINNAAITGDIIKSIDPVNAYAPFEEQPLNLWQKTIDVNLTGCFLLAREAGKRMRKNGGSFITVSSIYGVVGPDQSIYENQNMGCRASYAASKAGIIGLTKWLSTWWADEGIRVNCVVPGGVENGQDLDFINRYSNRVPMARMAMPEDIVGIMLYLLSDASRYCTGGVYLVDGGLTAW